MTRIKYQPEQREKRIPKGHKPGCLCRACAGTRGELQSLVPLGVKITPELDQTLREKAGESGATLTEIVQQALVAWLEK